MDLDSYSDSDLDYDSDSGLHPRKIAVLEEIFSKGPRTARDLEKSGHNRQTVSKDLVGLKDEYLVKGEETRDGIPRPYALTVKGVRTIRPKWDRMTPLEQMLSTHSENWIALGIDSDLVLQSLTTSLRETYRRVLEAKLEQPMMRALWRHSMIRKMPWYTRKILGNSVWNRHIHNEVEEIRNEHRIWRDVWKTIRQFQDANIMKLSSRGLEVVEPFATNGILEWLRKIELEAGMDLRLYASNRDWRKQPSLEVKECQFHPDSSPFFSELPLGRIELKPKRQIIPGSAKINES